VSALEFVVLGTPISAQASPDAKRLWRERVRGEATAAAATVPWLPLEEVVLRVAYFYVDAPAADLDNILKLIQDSLKGIAYDDDIQVVDLIASMRPKSGSDLISMSAVLSKGFAGNSDFVYISVQSSSVVEVLR
jgi:crossover junction endodeoxyribonuclease RusA